MKPFYRAAMTDAITSQNKTDKRQKISNETG